MKSWMRNALIHLASVALFALLAACASRATPAPTATPTALSPVTPLFSTATLTSPPIAPEETVVPSPTPTSTATPSPTLTPTHTPSPTATPTPLPDVRLQLGRTFYQQGNYAAAIEQFQALLADPASEPDEAVEARYRLGQCYLLDGKPSLAAATFQDFVDARPDDARWPAAHFQLAEARAALGEWAAAIEGYQTYLAARDAVAAAVYERIGDACVQRQDDAQALESYQAALERAPYLDQALALREKIAEIHIRQKAYDLAIDQYETILAAARLDNYRAQIEYLLGQTYVQAGAVEKAYEHWGTAVQSYPKAHHAYLSLVELVNASVEVNEFQRGMVDLYAGVYGAAVQALYRYLESDATEHRVEARYYVGRAYQLSGSYGLAIKEYDALIAAYPDDAVTADAWLAKARSLAAQGRTDAAVETLQAFVEAQPDHKLAPEALWQVAQLHEGAADWAKAAAAGRQLSGDYPASERAAEALFRAGLSSFRLGDYRAAIEDWQAFVVAHPTSDRLSAVRYWLSKAYSALGDDVQTDKWLALAAKSFSFLPDYYALRAGHRLEASKTETKIDPSGESWPAARPNLLLDFNQAAAQAEAEAWLLTWVDPGGEMENLDTLTETLAQDLRYQRGVEYLALGLRSEAMNEFEIMRQARQDEPLVMYGLALASRELGVYQTSLRCALQVIRLSPARTVGNAPLFLRRLAYPTYFDDLVLAEAAANNLDPLLVFALIRQESLFEPVARSYAQAIGLMQIIPSTGEWIALRLGWRDFAPEQLTRPYLNVRFGTWFLAQGLDSFQGDVFAALAAYNSGLTAPRRWLDAASGDPDLFVETIDYSQTLHYVQLIYQHHALYRQIYQPDS